MKSDHYDVLIVGAGLSGIGMACHLRRNCPQATFQILEARQAIGGTWDLFRYPGVRADSDMDTLRYKFKPWDGQQEIADGKEILRYIRETAKGYKVDSEIRFGHKVLDAAWSTPDARWTITAEHDGETKKLTARFLLPCSGYYKYSEGYAPVFQGRESFQGRIVHPQHWPRDLDYTGKRVIVIGSGATAVSLVPVLAEQARHVVMLQRSPTYMIARPEVSRWRTLAGKLLPSTWVQALGRWVSIRLGAFFYRRCRQRPDRVRTFLLNRIRRQLGPDFDIETHFGPRYNPWEQRLCVVRNSDLFEAIKAKRVTMVTDHIDQFIESGVRLNSGKELQADLIVTATGLVLQMLGGVQVTVDGKPVDLSQTYTYKGMMVSEVPNFISTFGYVNASWTLRSDLIAEFTCRLFNYLQESGLRYATPRLRDSDQGMESKPFIEHFSSGYLQRALSQMPKQGDREPWLNPQDYELDRKRIANCNLGEDDCLVFV